MGPMFLRTLLAGSTWGEGKFGYSVAEYNLSNGSWRRVELPIDDTKMRIEKEGQQFETYIRDWQLSSKGLWLKDYVTYLAVRSLRNYSGLFPQPVY